MSDKIRTSDLLEEAIKDLQLTIRDAEKADAGNVSAGIRVRKRMQEVIANLKLVRKVISDIKHALKAEKEQQEKE
jgi:hypothetical protein